MKRILFISFAALVSVGLVQAWGCNRGCAPRNSCPQRVVRQADCPPKCCKTIQVPQTIMVPKVIEVAAIKEVTPRPDIISYRANAPIEVRFRNHQ